MASNTNTARGRMRVTYVEEESVVKALEKMASESGLTLSTLVRQATWEYTKTRRTTNAAPITRDKDRGKGAPKEK